MSLTVCNDGHEEIAYNDGRYGCPLCAARKEASEHEATADRMGKENDNLCDDNFELKREIESLKDRIAEFISVESHGEVQP